MLQKYRVFCPHCSASLLVTEDLMGKQAECPGCRDAFILPTIDDLAVDAPGEAPATSAQSSIPDLPPVREPVAAVDSVAAPVVDSPSSSIPRRHLKPVKIERRPELRFFSGLLKIVALVQVLVSAAMLVVTIVGSMQSHPGTPAVLMSIGTSMLIGIGSVPTYAFAELILVFAAQEEMLRHILNELRHRD